MATPSTLAAPFSTFDAPNRSDNMALIFQEVFTVIVRLRANRQRVSDADVFRNQLRNALKAAAAEGTRRGYPIEDVRPGVFAVIAFLDESILNSQNPVLADWHRKPMQKEVFGVQAAGEIFFKNLERLLGLADSVPLADLLEVHQLCLLLGFRGRYSASGQSEEIQSFLAQIEDKVRRIRGVGTPLPRQQPSREGRVSSRRWTRKLSWIAVACVAFALILFTGYKISLASSVEQLKSLASEIGQ